MNIFSEKYLTYSREKDTDFICYFDFCRVDTCTRGGLNAVGVELLFCSRMREFNIRFDSYFTFEFLILRVHERHVIVTYVATSVSNPFRTQKVKFNSPRVSLRRIQKFLPS